MRNWRLCFIVLTVCLLVGATSSEAITGLGFGVRGGLGGYGGDVFKESGDVGSSILYGGHIKVGTLPIVDFYLNVEYFAKDEFYTKRYTKEKDGFDYEASVDFRDFSVSLDGKVNLYSFPASPVSIYIGGGVGSHILNTDLATDIPEDAPTTVKAAFELFRDKGKFDIHGLLGAKVNPPVVPLEFFVEGRYAFVMSENEEKYQENLNAMSVVAGVTFNLP